MLLYIFLAKFTFNNALHVDGLDKAAGCTYAKSSVSLLYSQHFIQKNKNPIYILTTRKFFYYYYITNL